MLPFPSVQCNYGLDFPTLQLGVDEWRGLLTCVEHSKVPGRRFRQRSKVHHVDPSKHSKVREGNGGRHVNEADCFTKKAN
jgi:hypothetical protein